MWLHVCFPGGHALLFHGDQFLRGWSWDMLITDIETSRRLEEFLLIL